MKNQVPAKLGAAIILLASVCATPIQAQFPAACTPYPDNCLYTGASPRQFQSATRAVTYRDVAGTSRTIELQIRVPAAAGNSGAALPVVIWSPGDSGDAMKNWSDATARAGYLTVTIGHTRRTPAEQVALCGHFKVPEGELCNGLSTLPLDRPNDIRAVLDELENVAGADMKRVAVAGHSEGSSAALSVAGAARLITTQDRSKPDLFADPRPAAFIALSPMGPAGEGFFDSDVHQPATSWTTIDRPVFLASGLGDNNCEGPLACVIGATPSNRRIPFDLLPSGAKYEIFVRDIGIYHDFLGSLDTADCTAKGVAPTKCADFERWLRSSVISFLDARLGGIPAAQTWLNNGLIRAASANTLEWRNTTPGISASTVNCPGFENCLYSPLRTYEVEEFAPNTIAYTDVTGRRRSFEIKVRYPGGKGGPLPVMIWAHGGGEGRNFEGASAGALKTWAEFSARAGYLSVAPAFHARDEADQAALCEYLGLVGSECENFNSVTWDRPYDIKAVLDTLTVLNRAGPYQGRVDLSRIGVGGHSAGSSGTLSVAGAYREIKYKRYGGPGFFADPRPKAFVGLSPSAPGNSSMFDTSFNDLATSWKQIERPVLLATGAADAHEQTPRGRRVPYDAMPAGDKYRIYFHDYDFGHESFGDGLSDCSTSTRAKCAAFQALLESAVLAFLDGYVLGLPQALEYTQNGYVQRAGRGVVEWSSK